MHYIINKHFSALIALAIANFSYAKHQKKSIDIYIPAPLLQFNVIMHHATHSDQLKKYNFDISIKKWRNPEQLKANIINGKIDIAMTPSNVAAALYNKGIDMRLMNIITSGLLYVISADKNVKSIKDLRAISMPFKNNMPDLVFRILAKKMGVLKNIDINYASSPQIVVIKAKLGFIDNVLVPEIAATKIISKVSGFRRAIDMRKTYGKVFNTKPYIPQAGIAVRSSIASNNMQFLRDLQKAMEKSAKKLLSSQAYTKQYILKNNLGDPKLIWNALEHSNINIQPSMHVIQEIEFFYKTLMNVNKKYIGGKMPDNKFYLNIQ